MLKLKNFLLSIFLLLIIPSISFSQCEVTIDGYCHLDAEIILYNGVPTTDAPAISNSGQAIEYFDSTLGKLQCSEDGGAYGDCVGGGGSTIVWDTVANLPASPVANDLAGVTDGSTAADCSTGGGGNRNLCVYNGSAWLIVGDGDTGAGGGESNTASNTGTLGVGLYKQKVGTDLEFYKISSANNRLSAALSGTDYFLLTFNESNVDHDALTNFLIAEHVDWAGAGSGTIHTDNYIEGHSNGANCSAGSYPLGVDASGAVVSCTDATTEIDSAILTHKNVAAAHHTATVDTTLNDTGAQVITGDWDFGGGGIEIENGTTPPACTTGQIYLDTDATSGQQLMGCEAGTFVVQGDGGGAETNSLETLTTGILVNEVPIGTATDTVVYAALSGDVTMDNAGVVTVVDDSHNHVIINIDTFTKANLETQTSDVVDYAEADGDVFTGIHDFGGATSIEIVNGTAPVVDAAGEIALDTTSDQFIYYGTAKRVLTYSKEKCVTLETPVDADDNIMFFQPRKAITITDVVCRVDGGTSIPLTISDGTNALEAITCATTATEDDGTILNGTFTALERMEFDLGTPVGTNTWLNFCITYVVDSD